MPTLRDIKRRITAVSNTKQITKAMKMVAASKLRKAQTRMMDMRSYADKMGAVIAGMSGTGEALHPLLVHRPRRTIEIVVITSDKGLCGAFNTNIIKKAEKFIAGWRENNFNVTVSLVGKKANDYFKRRDVTIRKAWVGMSGRLHYADVSEIAHDITENYMEGAFDEVFLVYNKFLTVMSQEVISSMLLPMAVPDSEEDAGREPTVYLYEPSQQDILNQILPKNLEIQIYRALLESQASEEAARMTAMENATQNADEMIDSLTLQYNKARQASITRELMDIVGGVEALKD